MQAIVQNSQCPPYNPLYIYMYVYIYVYTHLKSLDYSSCIGIIYIYTWAERYVLGYLGASLGPKYIHHIPTWTLGPCVLILGSSQNPDHLDCINQGFGFKLQVALLQLLNVKRGGGGLGVRR